MEPEDHMDKSWLVDKEGITKRLPKGCHAIGNFILSLFIEKIVFLSSSGSTNRGIIGVKPGEAFELENNYDDEVRISINCCPTLP